MNLSFHLKWPLPRCPFNPLASFISPHPVTRAEVCILGPGNSLEAWREEVEREFQDRQWELAVGLSPQRSGNKLVTTLFSLWTFPPTGIKRFPISQHLFAHFTACQKHWLLPSIIYNHLLFLEHWLTWKRWIFNRSPNFRLMKPYSQLQLMALNPHVNILQFCRHCHRVTCNYRFINRTSSPILRHFGGLNKCTSG